MSSTATTSEPNPDWAPPPDPAAAPPTARRTGWLVWGSLLLTAALLIGLTWRFGGFEQRSDTLHDAAPGTLLSAGPFELRFTEVTAQQRTNFDDTPYWELIAIGEGRTTGDESISPRYSGDYGMFVSRDDATREIQGVYGVTMGTDETFERHTFTPGLPMIRYTVTFRYTANYRPGPTLRMLVFDQKFGQFYLVSDEEGWRNANDAYQLQLPVRVLPPGA